MGVKLIHHVIPRHLPSKNGPVWSTWPIWAKRANYARTAIFWTNCGCVRGVSRQKSQKTFGKAVLAALDAALFVYRWKKGSKTAAIGPQNSSTFTT